MVRAPGYKRPVRSMPQPNQHHHNKHVAIQNQTPLPSPTKWHEHIVAHPRGKCDMPPLPQIRRVPRQEWAREIQRKFKTEEFGAATSNVSVPREVEKHLHEEGKTAGPRSQPTRVRHWIVEVRIGDDSKPIRKHHLLY